MADYTASKMANSANSSLRKQIGVTKAAIAQKTKLGQDATKEVERLGRQQGQSKKGFGTDKGMAGRAKMKNAGAIGAAGGGQPKGTAGQLASARRMKGRTTYAGKVGPTKNKRNKGVPI